MKNHCVLLVNINEQSDPSLPGKCQVSLNVWQNLKTNRITAEKKNIVINHKAKYHRQKFLVHYRLLLTILPHSV